MDPGIFDGGSNFPKSFEKQKKKTKSKKQKTKKKKREEERKRRKNEVFGGYFRSADVWLKSTFQTGGMCIAEISSLHNTHTYGAPFYYLLAKCDII